MEHSRSITDCRRRRRTCRVVASEEELPDPNGLCFSPDHKTFYLISIWFTDPGYGDQIAEGHPDEAGGPANPQGILNPRSAGGDAGCLWTWQRASYHVSLSQA
jgi:hypothetical protein